jgi:transposase
VLAIVAAGTPNDHTGPEWAHAAALIPPTKRGGNRRHVDVREVVDGLMYIRSTGCQWREVSKDLPTRSTLHDYFDLWGWDGTLERIYEALYVKRRETAAREASLTVQSSTARAPRA